MLYSPAAERNKNVILNILKPLCTKNNFVKILEIASGSGEHCIHFAAEIPSVQWQPTDIDEASVKSIDARISASGLCNVSSARRLDVADSDWTADKQTVDLVFSANMIHISPWSCTQALFSGSSKHLKENGVLFTYGPYMDGGVIEAQSNVDFDASLKSRNPEWGLRDIDDLVKLATKHFLRLTDKIDVPANNKILVFTKEPCR